MSDLISRSATLEILRQAKRDRPLDSDRWVISDIATKVCKLPEPSAKLIRCKDCKYMTEHYDTDGNVPYWTCSEWDSGTDYNGFCHYAERRTDG